MNFPAPSEQQSRVIWFCLTALCVAVLLALVGIICWGIGWLANVLGPVLLPLAVATILAYILDPIVDYIESRKIPRPRAILLVFFMGAALMLGLLATVAPQLVVETKELVRNVPAYSQRLKNRVESSEWGRRINQALQFPKTPPSAAITVKADDENFPRKLEIVPSTDPEPTSPLSEKIVSLSSEILPEIGTWLAAQVKRIGSWLGLLIGFFLVPVYTFYFLKEKRGIEANWKNYLPVHDSTAKEEIVFILSSINDSMIVFFRGQVLVALCSGALLTIAFLVLGLNYAVMLGVMAGLLGIIPYLGVMMSVVPATALAAVQFNDWWHPAIVIGVFIIVNMLEGLAISPKIIGDRVGLHPLTIIVAVMIGTTLMGGILGGVLAIPLTAALRAIMFRYVWKPRR
jgi:predicted PurR-regulated permease PerM